jgi:L-rhamnose-H+ transport protein
MMMANPFRGVVFHWLGGLASGSFYVPYRGVKKWAWEVYWLVGGFFSWIIAPWILALINTKDLLAVLRAAPPGCLVKTYIFGLLWGVGGLTFGLTMRYLGMSLGMGVALGYCAVIGTLVPPVLHHEFAAKVLGTSSGLVILIGILVCILGIAVAGMAGMSKEREMTEEQKKSSIKEFNFFKGILVATFSGVFSACFAMGLDAGTPIADLSAQHGTSMLWTGLPKLCVVLLGGFTSNFIWCVILNLKNRTGYQYFSRRLRREPPKLEAETIIKTALDAPGEEVVKGQAKGLPLARGLYPRASTAEADPLAKPGAPASAGVRANAPAPAAGKSLSKEKRKADGRVPMAGNYFFSALAGLTWYMQFFFYTMGETQMGNYKFSSWTIHMASIIIFSSLWGIALKEWKGSSGFTKTLLAMGLAALIFSTVIVGYGNYLATLPAGR